MQAIRGTCTHVCRRRPLRCQLGSGRRLLSAASSESSRPIPWFVDPSDAHKPSPSPAFAKRPIPPHLQSLSSLPVPPLPSSLPADSPIAHLHAQLKTSPHLEPSMLQVREPVPTPVGPPLPDAMPKGRRKRGRTYAGEGVADTGGGIWSWIVVAQVKEGTENRGGIEAVIRLVRKTLLTATPPLPLPPNRKRQISDGWAMIDAGDFAVHIVSREARQKYFPERRDW